MAVVRASWMVVRVALIVLMALVAFGSGAWAALALWYQLPGRSITRVIASLCWACLVITLLVLAIAHRSWLPLLAYAACYTIVLLWWLGIAPSNRRIWADDVSQLLTGQLHGNRVVLENVRNFSWRRDDDYDACWETREYDLDRLLSTDAVLSHWSSRAIAHAMISFGFDDGRHVVFSVEIRKRRGQQYSAIGGFFKQYETVLVAADENDIIRVRTHVRDEDDYLYPLRMGKSAMRTLFLSYVHAANQLAARPAFYNTLTSNCTTLVYRMARQIAPGLHWDARLLLTGYLPGYLYQVGALDRNVPLGLLRQRGRITERARAVRPQEDFSQAIRCGMPAACPPPV
jgi:hypothetical protein